MNRNEIITITNMMCQAGMDSTAKLIWRHDLEQREALARVEAERDAARSRQEHTQSTLRTVLAELQSSQAQLAEAVGLLSAAVDYCYSSEAYEKGRAFLARHAQAEQQEAQGAQAGDELDAIAEAIFNADKDNWFSVGPYPQLHANDKARLRAMARATLATQPTVRGAEHE